MTNAFADIHHCNEESEVIHDVIRNTTPMTIDGTVYLVSFGFSCSATQTLADRLKSLIYKDLHSDEAISENLS